MNAERPKEIPKSNERDSSLEKQKEIRDGRTKETDYIVHDAHEDILVGGDRRQPSLHSRIFGCLTVHDRKCQGRHRTRKSSVKPNIETENSVLTIMREVPSFDFEGNHTFLSLYCPGCDHLLYRCEVCNAMTIGEPYQKARTEDKFNENGMDEEYGNNRYCESCNVLLPCISDSNHSEGVDHSSLQGLIGRKPQHCFSAEDVYAIQSDAFGMKHYYYAKVWK